MMKLKIIAILTTLQPKMVREWEYITLNLKTRITNFREQNQSFYREGHLTKLTQLKEIFDNPSSENIINLITHKNFLSRTLPIKKYDYYIYLTRKGSESTEIRTALSEYQGENHFALIELACLVQSLNSCWNQLNTNQKELVIDFLINKTDETLYEHPMEAAPCFTLFLKGTLDGLIKSQPDLKQSFADIIAKRKQYYQSRPSAIFMQ